MQLRGVDHIAIIVSNRTRALNFYVHALGCEVATEQYRVERDSWKIDLYIPGSEVEIELFTFPDAPQRPSNPEAIGARHLAIRVTDIEEAHAHCAKHELNPEPIRVDSRLGRRFFFIKDPDGLPIELVEM
jgi:glyoxylase I family protein